MRAKVRDPDLQSLVLSALADKLAAIEALQTLIEIYYPPC
jgi:hypothetical protein